MKILTYWRTLRCPTDPARYRAPETIDHVRLSGFIDGKNGRVTTTEVVKVQGRDVWTKSGSHYHLGPVAPDFAMWLAEHGLVLDDANPVKLLTRRDN